MNAVAKKVIIILSIIAGVLAIVGASMVVLLSKPSTVVARSDRLETPVVKGVEKEGDNYMLSFSYIPDAIGYRVSEYDTINDERHTQTYSGSQIKYAGGEYVKVDITDFLFATHTEEDFKQYTFTVLARFSDPVFDSKESEQFVYNNKITLATPTISTINPQSSSVKWDSIEFATSYTLHLDDQDDSNNDVVVSTAETYVTFEQIKNTFGEQDSYKLYVVAHNKSITKKDFIFDSEESDKAEYIPNGKIDDFVLSFNQENMTLSWDKQIGADVYKLFISTFGVGAYANSVDNKNLFTIGEQTVDCDLSNIEYAKYIGVVEVYVIAESNNSYVASGESNVVSYTNTAELTAPSNISVESDSTYLHIVWDAPKTNAGLVSGYEVTIFNYTSEQASNSNIISAPYNYLGQVARSGYTSSLTECTVPLGINPAGFYGVAVRALSTTGSIYTDSKDAYFKNESGFNLYNANKLLEAPKAIVAKENADGTISVSWNIVENARRYFVKINQLDESNQIVSTRTIPVVDNREEFNRVNTTIPPQTITDLTPGKYTIEVATESEGYLISNGEYNSSVSYPEGQNFVAYRTSYDTSDLNLAFNEETQVLSWNKIATTFDVCVQFAENEPQTVATVVEIGSATTCSFDCSSFFADYHNATGDYKLWVVLKGLGAGDEKYRVDTASTQIDYAFKQSYQAPTELKVNNGAQTNERILSWQPSVNATSTTTYTIKLNGVVLSADCATTSFDVSDCLRLGENTIEVFANGDDINKVSASTQAEYTFVYTLTQIDGDIIIEATTVEYDTPIVTVSFNEVKNAEQYVVKINNSEETTYVANVFGGVATFTLTKDDVLKLLPFAENTIVVTPNASNTNISVVGDISKTTLFTNNFYLPTLTECSIDTTELNSHIVAQIANKQVNLSFKALVLNDSTVQNYRVVIKDNNGAVLNTFDFALTDGFVLYSSETELYTLNIFDVLKKSDDNLFRGAIKVGISAVVDMTNFVVVSPVKFASDLTIETGLADITNITYSETQEGMMLSWDSVEFAESYDITVAGQTLENNPSAKVDLQNILFDKEIGNYQVTITSKLDKKTNSTTTTITVEKQLNIFNIMPVENNTKLKIEKQNLPRTLYGGEDKKGFVYATNLMLVFDSVDGVEKALAEKITSDSQLAGFKCMLVTIDTSADLEIDLGNFAGAQTCYVYAFNTDNIAGFSEYATIDLLGAVRYLEPMLTITDDEQTLEISWNVEYITSGENQVAPNYYFDVLSLSDGKSVLTSDNVNVTGGVLSGSVITAEADAQLIVCKVLGLSAGGYVVKTQARTKDNAVANSSNYVEQEYVFKKSLPTPSVQTSTNFDGSFGNPAVIDEIIRDGYSNSDVIRLYFRALQTVDSIELKTFALTVKSSTETLVDKKQCVLTSSDTNGYYFELTKSVLGISTDGIYEIYVNYVSPNDQLYVELEPTKVLTFEVSNVKEDDISVKNVKIKETDSQLIVSWTLATYNGNSVPVSYTIAETTVKNSIKTSATYSKTDNLTTKIAIKVESCYAGSITNTPFETDYVLNNYQKSFVYTAQDSENSNRSSMTITLDNKTALNTTVEGQVVTAISLNGYVYDASAVTLGLNTIKFASTTENEIENGVLNTILPTLDANRTVKVVVYAGSNVLYDSEIENFPVIINQYVDSTSIEIVNDDLCWSAVPYAQSYKVHCGSDTLSEVLVNSVALSKVFTASGSYNVYVEILGDESKNIYVTNNGYTAQEIIYVMPYKSVVDLTYVQTEPSEFSDNTDYQYIKTLSWKLAENVGSPVFTVTLKSVGQDDIVLTISDAVADADGVYSLNVSDSLNKANVGEYSVSVVVDSSDADDNRTISRPTTIVFTNKKFMSIPTADWQQNISVGPSKDDLTFDNNVPTSQSILSSNDFNTKTFTLHTPFKYATKVQITLKSAEKPLIATMNNTAGATCSIKISDSVYTISVALMYDRDDAITGEMKYFEVPNIDESGIECDGNTKTVTRTYENCQFDFMEATPIYTIDNTVDVDWQNGKNGANTITLDIQNLEQTGSYVVAITAEDNSTKIKTYDATDVALRSVNEILSDLDLSYGKYKIKIAKLPRDYVDGTELSHFITSFYGAEAEFDFHYRLGNIKEVTYNNGVLEWLVLQVEDGMSVNYALTLIDNNDNKKTFNCTVNKDAVTGAYVLEQADGGFSLDDTKLTFDVSKFADDVSRTDYYLVGDYTFGLYAYDGDISEEVVLPNKPSKNNIVSNETTEGEFEYNVEFPIVYASSTLDGNTLSWKYTITNSGLSIAQDDAWEYSLNGGATWKTLKDVEVAEVNEEVEGVQTKFFVATTGFLLSASERSDMENDFKIRLNITSNEQYVKDIVGNVVQIVSNPQLPNVTFSFNTETAKDLSFVFDFAGINRATQNQPYFLSDLNNDVWQPKLEITIKCADNTYTLSELPLEELLEYYKNRGGLIDITKLLMEVTNDIINTTNDGAELKNGTYEISICLKDTKSEETSVYQNSTVFKQTVVIQPRWNIENVGLNVDIADNNITYYSEIKDKTDKGVGTNKAQNWSNNLRNSVLSFDITNVPEGASKEDVVVSVWLTAYKDYVDNSKTLVTGGGENTSSLSGAPTDFVPSIAQNSSIVDAVDKNNNPVWHVSLDVTSIWTTVTAPVEYFLVFSVKKLVSQDEILRRNSASSAQSDDANDALKDDTKDEKDFTIVHYKKLAEVTLANGFKMDKDGDTYVEWTTSNTVKGETYSFDVTIQEAIYDANTQSFVYKDGSVVSYKEVLSSPCKVKFSLKNEACYKVTVALSNVDSNSYYVGSSQENKTKSSDTKIYQFVAVCEAPSGLQVSNGTSLSNDHTDTTLNSDWNVLVVKEGADINNEKVTITFNAVGGAVAYKLVVRDKNGNEINTYIIGKKFTVTNDDKIYIYYYKSGDSYLLYTDEQNTLAIPEQVYFQTEVGSINNNTITLDGFTLSMLFGLDTDYLGGDYSVCVSAWACCYYLKMAYNGLDKSKNLTPLINTDVNSINAVNELGVRYYIKFEQPTINASVVSGGDVETSNGITYVKNNGGKYSYQLRFEINNLGTSTLSKKVAIFLHENYNLYDALIVDLKSYQKDAYTVEWDGSRLVVTLTITDNNALKFATLVNESLPNNTLIFHAMILPSNNWTASLPTTEADANDTNKFVSGNAINSMISDGSSPLNLSVQLPNLNYAMYVDQKIQKTAQQSLVSMGANNLYTVNSFGTNGSSTGAQIACDPYLGVNPKANYDARNYLSKIFNDKTNAKNFGVNVYLGGDVIKSYALSDVLSCYANQKASTSLYDILKEKYANGGKVTLGIELVCSETGKYITSEKKEISFTFYVRSELNSATELSLVEEKYNDNNKLIFKTDDGTTKSDFLYKTVMAKISQPTTGDTITETLDNNKLLVRMTFGGQNSYYFVVDNSVDTNNMDVMGNWINKIYRNNAKAFDSDLSYVNALFSGQFEFAYSVIPTGEYYACNYITDNTLSYTPTLKLASTQIYAVYTTDESVTVSDVTIKNINGDADKSETYKSQTVVDMRPIFSNVNTSAVTLKWWIKTTSISDTGTQTTSQSTPDGSCTILSDTSNALGNTISKWNKDSTLSNGFLNSILNYLETNNLDAGAYTICYSYSYAENSRCEDSDCDKSFEFGYYKVTDQNPAVLYVVNDGKAKDTKNEPGINEIQDAIETSFDASADGLLVYMQSTTPNISMTVYLKQTNYRDGTVINTNQNDTNNDCITFGTITISDTESDTVYVNWVFFKFDKDKSDALDNTDYDEEAVVNLTNNNYTNYIGYIQGGSNSFYIIPTITTTGSNGDYDLVNYSKDKVTNNTSFKVSHLGTVSKSFQIDASKYLTFDDVNCSTKGSNFVGDNATEALTNLVQTSGGNGNLIVCPDCMGFGHIHVARDEHRVGNASDYELGSTGGGGSRLPRKDTFTYTCKDCGKTQTYNSVQYTEKGLVFDESICEFDIECQTCNGTGVIQEVNDTLTTYEKVLEYQPLVEHFNAQNKQLLSWMPGEDGLSDDKTIISIQVVTASDTGETQGDKSVYAMSIYDVTLEANPSLSSVTLYTEIYSMLDIYCDSTLVCSIHPKATDDKKRYYFNITYEDISQEYCGKALTFVLAPKSSFANSKCFASSANSTDILKLNSSNTDCKLPSGNKNKIQVTFDSASKPPVTVESRALDMNDMFTYGYEDYSGGRTLDTFYFSFKSNIINFSNFNFTIGYDWTAIAYFEPEKIFGLPVGIKGDIHSSSDKTISLGVLLANNGSTSYVDSLNESGLEVSNKLTLEAVYRRKGINIWDGFNCDKFDSGVMNATIYCYSLSIGDSDTFKYTGDKIYRLTSTGPLQG